MIRRYEPPRWRLRADELKASLAVDIDRPNKVVQDASVELIRVPILSYRREAGIRGRLSQRAKTDRLFLAAQPDQAQ
jgi:hypothetical protein